MNKELVRSAIKKALHYLKVELKESFIMEVIDEHKAVIEKLEKALEELEKRDA